MSNISNQNSSGHIRENNKKLPEETNTNPAMMTVTEREILECLNNASLENSNENNETNPLNMGTTTKLSNADSCFRIGTSVI